MGWAASLEIYGSSAPATSNPQTLPRWSDKAVVIYGSFNLFVEVAILPGIENGALDRADMIDIVAALRRWEVDGTWDRTG